MGAGGGGDRAALIEPEHTRERGGLCLTPYTVVRAVAFTPRLAGSLRGAGGAEKDCYGESQCLEKIYSADSMKEQPAREQGTRRGSRKGMETRGRGSCNRQGKKLSVP